MSGEQVMSYLTRNGYRHAAAAVAFDDAQSRGDVAPAADGMPRSMASRCSTCGVALTVREVPFGEYCEMCAKDHGVAMCSTPVVESTAHPPNPDNVHAPKGSAPAPDGGLSFEDELDLAEMPETANRDVKGMFAPSEDAEDESQLKTDLDIAMADFDEAQHPRADDGKFTSGGGSDSGGGAVHTVPGTLSHYARHPDEAHHAAASAWLHAAKLVRGFAPKDEITKAVDAANTLSIVAASASTSGGTRTSRLQEVLGSMNAASRARHAASDDSRGHVAVGDIMESAGLSHIRATSGSEEARSGRIIDHMIKEHGADWVGALARIQKTGFMHTMGAFRHVLVATARRLAEHSGLVVDHGGGFPQ